MTQIASKGQARRVLRTRTTSQANNSQHAAGQQVAEHCARSQRGASMPLALLLFLICALLASVVLSAASAVTGRHVQLADMDQKFYSVVSAVNLLEEELCGQPDNPVVVTCVKTEKRERTVNYNTGDESAPTTSLQEVNLSINGNSVATVNGENPLTNITVTNFSFRECLALSLMFKQNVSNSINKSASDVFEAAWFLKGSGSELTELGTHTLVHRVTSNTKSDKVSNTTIEDALKANVVANVDNDRVLKLTIQSDDDNPVDMYAVSFDCSTDVNTSERTEESIPTITEHNGIRTETVTVTTTREAEINWTLLRTEKA